MTDYLGKYTIHEKHVALQVTRELSIKQFLRLRLMVLQECNKFKKGLLSFKMHYVQIGLILIKFNKGS